MTGLLKFTQISCVSHEAQEKVLAAYKDIVEHVLANKSGVVQYLVTTPLEDSSEHHVHVIEEFVDQDSHDAHQIVQPVKDLGSLLEAREIASERPQIHISPIAVKATCGSPLPLSATPAILLVGMEYKPGTSSSAVTGWIGMAQGAVERVPGVNVFTVMEDAETSCIRTIEVLDSWDSLSVLVKTDAAKQNIKQNGKDRTGVKTAIKVHAVAGFVGR